MFYHFIMGWRAGNSLFQGFPRAFLGLEHAGSPNLPLFYSLKAKPSYSLLEKKQTSLFFQNTRKFYNPFSNQIHNAL